MTREELADWFHISTKSFLNSRIKKLEELEKYAEFEYSREKVNIKKIYKEYYIKKNSRNYKIIKQTTEDEWDESGYDTCKLVAEKIMNKYGKNITLSNNTAYIYTCQSRAELWGKPFSCCGGERGFCIHELCKEVDGKCIPFTEEEQKIKKELLVKYFGDAIEKQLLIEEMIARGELKENEAWAYYREITSLKNKYAAFLTDMIAAVGEKIVRATKISESNHVELGD